MTELEILNAALEAAVSEQIKADEISRHYDNEVEKLKRMMVEVKRETSQNQNRSKTCLKLEEKLTERFKRCATTHTARTKQRFL